MLTMATTTLKKTTKRRVQCFKNGPHLKGFVKSTCGPYKTRPVGNDGDYVTTWRPLRLRRRHNQACTCQFFSAHVHLDLLSQCLPTAYQPTIIKTISPRRIMSTLRYAYLGACAVCVCVCIWFRKKHFFCTPVNNKNEKKIMNAKDKHKQAYIIYVQYASKQKVLEHLYYRRRA